MQIRRRRFRTWQSFGNLHELSRSGFSQCHKQQGALAKIYLQIATQFCYFNLVASPTCRLRVCLNYSRYNPTQVHSLHVCRRISLTKTQQKRSKTKWCFITCNNICVRITQCSTVQDSQSGITFFLCI